MKGQSPSARTKAMLEADGFQVAIVERWKPAPRVNRQTGQKELAPYGVRVDAFGFGDLLACKPGEGIFLVQCCAATDHAKRRLKILTECRWQFSEWLASAGRVLLISWAKQGAKGERKLWRARTEELRDTGQAVVSASPKPVNDPVTASPEPNLFESSLRGKAAGD